MKCYTETMLKRFFESLEWHTPKPNLITLETIPKGPCLYWKGSLRGDGYGVLHIPRKERYLFGNIAYVRSHRMSYEVFYNVEVPKELHMRHTCDTPICCNPHHLEPGTNKQNRTDSVQRGRHAQGIRHGAAKLPEGTVREILRRVVAGQSGAEIAEKFGVSRQLICAIKKGRAWSHIVGQNGMPSLTDMHTPKGKLQPACSFTVNQVRDMRARAASGIDLNVIAAEHHVPRRTIYRIVTKRRYPNVPD